MTDYTNLSARAMLVSLKLTAWTARKFDKKVTERVNSESHAAATAGRYNKYLLPAAKQHHDIMLRVGDARLAHYHETLPWTDEGWRVLPTANWMSYTNRMRRQHEEWEVAVDHFVSVYPQLLDQAPDALGELFSRADYPTPEQVRPRFTWSLDFAPVPSAGDLRVELPADIVKGIADSVESRVRKAAVEAMADAWQRLYNVVHHMRERLSQPDAVFRNTLVENTRDVVDVLLRLNVGRDEKLE